MKKIETRRRIVLTGTPLQNNLVEYHCMVNFVKPNLLGTMQEFKNRFVNPINNGQHSDSKTHDVRLMKEKAFCLHKLLEGTVSRKDFSEILKYLPKKNEYVLSIRMSPMQVELYRTYLAKIRKINDAEATRYQNVKIEPALLFNDYQQLARIWTHPWLLKINEKVVEKRKRNKADKDFINDDDEDDEVSTRKKQKSSKSINLENYYYEDEVAKGKDIEWYRGLVRSDCQFDISLSGKMILFEQILDMSMQRGDKLYFLVTFLWYI